MRWQGRISENRFSECTIWSLALVSIIHDVSIKESLFLPEKFWFFLRVELPHTWLATCSSILGWWFILDWWVFNICTNWWHCSSLNGKHLISCIILSSVRVCELKTWRKLLKSIAFFNHMPKLTTMARSWLIFLTIGLLKNKLPCSISITY